VVRQIDPAEGWDRIVHVLKIGAGEDSWSREVVVEAKGGGMRKAARHGEYEQVRDAKDEKALCSHHNHGR
jgi:hypothetical protein